MKIKTTFLHKLICLFFPERCPFCDEVVVCGAIACDICLKKFPEIDYVSHAKGGYICVSPFLYNDIFKKSVLRLKNERGKQHAFQLAYILGNELKKQYDGIAFDLITYVPMHNKDFKKRGFNQSFLLANELSKRVGFECVQTLNKIKRTPPQHTLSAKEREKNLHKAYSIVDKSIVEGKTILIIDDVVTTGATLGECCDTLIKNGAKDVFCITLCKTPL